MRKWSYQNVRSERIEDFITRFPSAKEVMIDGTERPIQRPKDKQKQKNHYSGKKKRTTNKHLVMTDQKKRVLVLSLARAGIHDKRQLNEEKLADFVPDDIPIHVDLGFQGLQNEFVNIKIPDKKPKGKELTQKQKQSNREKSSVRI